MKIRNEALLVPMTIGITDALFKPNPMLWVGAILATALINGRVEPYATSIQIGAGAIVGREAMRRLM